MNATTPKKPRLDHLRASLHDRYFIINLSTSGRLEELSILIDEIRLTGETRINLIVPKGEKGQ